MPLDSPGGTGGPRHACGDNFNKRLRVANSQTAYEMISGGGRLAEIDGAYRYSSPDSTNFGDLTWQYPFPSSVGGLGSGL
jgi:hypothetical protein